MGITNVGQYAYSSYEGWDEYPLRCLTYLIEHNESIWKILKYNLPNAWDNDGIPNLTHAEKAALIYAGDGQIQNYSVFLDIGQDEVFTQQKTVLRISNYSLVPDNRTVGTATLIFEVYSHYQINQMSNQRTRTDMIIQQLLQTFNGKEIGLGLGKLFFDKSAVAANRAEVGGQIPYRGKWMLMSNRAGG